MRARTLVGTLATLAVAISLPAVAAAQGNIGLTLSSAAIAFDMPGVAHFDTEWIEHPGIVASVTSTPTNRAWELRIRADAATLGGYGKPVSEVEWRRDGSAVWTPLSTTDVGVIQGTGAQDVTIYFRTYLSWYNDVPGGYSAGLTLTAIRQ